MAISFNYCSSSYKSYLIFSGRVVLIFPSLKGVTGGGPQAAQTETGAAGMRTKKRKRKYVSCEHKHIFLLPFFHNLLLPTLFSIISFKDILF